MGKDSGRGRETSTVPSVLKERSVSRTGAVTPRQVIACSVEIRKSRDRVYGRATHVLTLDHLERNCLCLTCTERRELKGRGYL